MTDLDEARIFHEGIELFNDGEWFEAHETWEDIWHLATGEKKSFYQGIIQCAVTMEHILRGNPRGVVKVFKSARSKFVGLPDVYMGIDIRRLLAELGAMVEAIENLPPSMFDPGKGPGLDLQVDLNDAPRIVLGYDPFASDSTDSD